jgi:hypothetical protein
MIAISKEEKDVICERFPNVHIVRTMKQKSKRHHYYCEEAKPVMRYLNKVRGYDVMNKPREGVYDTSRKNSKRVKS